ncbi:MAG: D-glycerate dehydrogenase [Dehalococcoidales bacterium]|nr:D-glycerate dehydrogenase [Dehalococcoidales bacterium]
MTYVVYITRKVFPEALDIIGRVAEVKLWESDAAIPYETLLEQVKNIDGLLCMLSDRVDAGVLDAAPRLKVVANYAVGFDNIDVAKATEKGIPVGNTPGVLSETTADLAFALLMAAARRIAESDAYTRRGQWRTTADPRLMIGQDVHHSTLGIIGMGRIGAEVARRGNGFQMDVLYHNRTRRPDVEKELGVEYVATLPELLRRSDFVSLNVPLTGDTRQMIGAAELAVMKPTAVLVNTARGPVVDQKALYQALKSGQIAAAALDVFEREPIPADDPLLTLDNVVFTPHIGSASIATRTRMAVMAAENIVAGLQGKKLPTCVNPEVYGGR